MCLFVIEEKAEMNVLNSTGDCRTGCCNWSYFQPSSNPLTNLFVAVWLLQINRTRPHNAALLPKQINTSSDRRCRSPLLSFSVLPPFLQHSLRTLPEHISSHSEYDGQTTSRCVVSKHNFTALCLSW